MSQVERDFDQVRRDATDEWLNLGKGSRLILDIFMISKTIRDRFVRHQVKIKPILLDKARII